MYKQSILSDKNFKDQSVKGFFDLKIDIKSEKQYQQDRKNTINSQPRRYYLDDSTFYHGSSFADYSSESAEESIRIKESNTHGFHRMFDLHGYTTIGAEEALRRIFTSIDRSKQHVIKINVGQGSHSQDRIAKLPEVVKKVASDLQLPAPVKHEKNPGYLLMILPPVTSTE